MKSIALIAAAAFLALAGCSSSENIKPPHELVDILPLTQPQQLWETQIGEGAGDTGVRLRPAYEDGVLYAASTSGTLAAVDAASGKILWQDHSDVDTGAGGTGDYDKDSLYSGGPAVSGDLLVVGTLDGHVYALNAGDGTQRWMATLSAGVLSAPAIAGNRIIVRTNDGDVYCLNAATGETEWVYDLGVVPALSLRGNGRVLVANGVVFFSTDNGLVVALRLDTGTRLWDVPISSGEGRTEIDRLDDADGPILIKGTTLYAAGYHGSIVAIDGPSAQVMWRRKFSTYTPMVADKTMIVAVDDASDVWGFDRKTGSSLWKTDKLDWRWLSGPALQNGYAVVGDLEGYVHWISTRDGTLAARMRLSDNAIRAQPLVVDDIAYVMDVAGNLAAYKLNAIPFF